MGIESELRNAFTSLPNAPLVCKPPPRLVYPVPTPQATTPRWLPQPPNSLYATSVTWSATLWWTTTWAVIWPASRGASRSPTASADRASERTCYSVASSRTLLCYLAVTLCANTTDWCSGCRSWCYVHRLGLCYRDSSSHRSKSLHRLRSVRCCPLSRVLSSSIVLASIAEFLTYARFKSPRKGPRPVTLTHLMSFHPHFLSRSIVL